ncbi:MAG TPA: hypothetical protein PKV21_05015 [bacterium]|nr:hypothetical protein [bacterium]HOM26850.1 hypothetical protein [bacterium]
MRYFCTDGVKIKFFLFFILCSILLYGGVSDTLKEIKENVKNKEYKKATEKSLSNLCN